MDRSRSTFPAPRRVMTAPHGPVSKPSPSSQSAAGLVETLYNHPNVKIIAFTASGRNRARSPGRAPADEEPGSLPSSSQLERTIAVGPFRIYRAPGSVAFLNCGSALQPILPKSQCWCIDEASNKFVLQIRRPQYWRIEVPVSDRQEQDLAHALRGVFDQILQFEKTECPFKRSFTILLPEKPNTPVKKRPWTPVRRSITPTALTAIEATPTPPAKTTRRKSESPAARQLKASMEATATPEEKAKAQAQGESAQESVAVQQPKTPQAPVVDSVDVGDKQESVDALKVEEQQESVVNHGQQDKKLDEIREDIPAPVRSSSEEVVESIKAPSAVLESPTPEPKSMTTEASTDLKDETDVSAKAPSPEQEHSVPSEVTEPVASVQTQPINSLPDTPATEIRSSPVLLPVKETEDRWEESPPLTAIRREEVPCISVEAQTPEKGLESVPQKTKTPVRPDIHDFIRSYEQKTATGVSSSPATETHPVAEESTAPAASTDDDDKSNASEESGQETTGEEEVGTGEILEGSGVVGARRKKLRGFRAGRSLAVPPQLTLITSPPSKSAASRQSPTRLPEDARGPISPAGSSDSFHSVQSWQSPLSSPGSQPKTPSTFPYPHDNILMPMRMSQYRDISDLTVTPDTKRTWDAASCGTNESSQESAATAPDMASETAEQAGKDTFAEGEATSTAIARRRPNIRHRATTSSISVSRALSPLPPAANLFSPTATSMRRLPTRSRLDLVRRVPMAIVAKTCEILLSPPSHLMNLMLRVAARIAAGEWRGMMFGYGESGETIPVQWDYSDGELSDWGDDDDFYMSQAEGSATSVVDPEEAFDLTGRSSEVD
ncbi:hypothetical protein ACHAQA_007938 [Verticillium albo-atrum]